MLAGLIIAVAGLSRASADPVPGWHFTTWSVPPREFKTAVLRLGLSISPATEQDAAIYGLPTSSVPFAISTDIYGQKATAYPIFRAEQLTAVRFVVERAADACKTVLDGLTADFGPGERDKRGFSNFNWPTSAAFGLTVVVTPEMCWPLFYKPGT